jgi:hypothetical protein
MVREVLSTVRKLEFEDKVRNMSRILKYGNSTVQYIQGLPSTKYEHDHEQEFGGAFR